MPLTSTITERRLLPYETQKPKTNKAFRARWYLPYTLTINSEVRGPCTKFTSEHNTKLYGTRTVITFSGSNCLRCPNK